MKIIIQIFFLFSLSIASINSLQAKEWRGIIPLHSAKAEADRILGKPIYESRWSAVYSLNSEFVDINFSANDYPLDCIKHLPPQTVLKINVTPKIELKLSDFQINGKGFKKIDSLPRQDPGFGTSAFLLGDVGYIDEEEGVVVRGYKGNLLTSYYFPSLKDRQLCESYYAYPEEYGAMRFDYIDGESLNKSASDKSIFQNISSCYVEIYSNPVVNCVVVNFGNDKEVSKRLATINKFFKRSKWDLRRFRFVRGDSKQSLRTKIYSFPIGTEPFEERQQ